MRTRYVRRGGGAMLNFSGNSVENPENPHCVAPGFLDIRNDNEYLCGMFIKAVQKRKVGKDSVAAKALIMADGNFCAVHECDACAFTKTNRIQQEHHRNKSAMLYLNKSTV
jgi:hypothetical protein